MSNQPFNIFLVQRLLIWLEQEIQAGYRYRFYSDDIERLQNILHVLSDTQSGTITYLNIDLPYIEVKGVRLVFVNDVESTMNEHFISNLRDAISKPEKVFSNSAFLVLHQSRLDTLLNSAHDLASERAPFHPREIKAILLKLCANTTKPKLFEALLDIQTKQINMDNQSAFGYEGIYESIESDNVDFKKLNLFEDQDLFNFDDRSKIQKRIEENQRLYTEIEYNIKSFPNELTEKLSKYSPEFIDRYITIDKWEDLSLPQLKESIEMNQGQNITFNSTFALTEEKYLIRDESYTPAGKRIHNIIIFTEYDFLSLILKFDGKGLLKQENFSIMDNDTLANTNALTYMHKKLDIQIPFDGKPLYFRVRLKTTKSSETHMFKFLILRKGSFYLDGIKNYFLVQPNKKELLLKLDSFELNFTAEDTGLKHVLSANENEVNIVNHPQLNVARFYNAHDEVKFSITNGVDSLLLALENEKIEDKISLPLLFNTKRVDKLLSNAINAEYNQTKNKAILDNREFLLVGERNSYVEYEHNLITHLAYKQEDRIFFSATELEAIDKSIAETYKALLNYFLTKKTTPSLCAWDDEVRNLATSFVESYLAFFTSISENIALTLDQKKLFELGFVKDRNRQFMSPFSPLVLSYILHLTKRIDQSYQELFDVTLKRLNPKGLFPYLFIDNDTYAYTKVIEEDPLWLEFVANEDNEFSYISKLTTEKIKEFKESFSALFDFRNDSPLIINSINNGHNKELFIGLVNFYKTSFNEPTKITVNLYDAKFEETEFDIFADNDSYDDIKSKYRLKDDDAQNIIDVMRTHITYSKHLTDEEQNYCHLSFFKNNEKVQIRNQNVLTKKSGLVYEGLISGESSEKKEGYYYNGFGLQGIELDGLIHLQLAKIFNALQRPVYESGSQYVKDNTIALMISDNFRSLLEKSYSSALWTVIIDPKVTLEFFQGYRDLILIHYSDQYSSSANYDAITVTAKTDLYASIVGSKDIISEFNAFNGEWLIKMITEQSNIQKEKNGIIAAYKYITGLLTTEEITWVPLSVAEMIRVSGNVGLSMSASDFSRYNASKEDEALKLGPISDDILLVGICKDGVILYPVEVKSGSANMAKAMQQTKALKAYFYNHLFNGDTLKSKLLKGLFIRQVLMQVEKYELYNVFDENYFDRLYEKREKLLDGDYSLVDFESHSEGAVVAFLDIYLDTSIKVKENVLECQLPYDFQSRMLHTSFTALRERLQNGDFGTRKSDLLEHVNCIEVAQQNITPDEDEVIPQVNPTEEVIISPVKIKHEEKTMRPEGPMKIKFGIDVRNQEDIIWYPTDSSKTLNTNTAIIGTMGTGKTQFTKALITQIIQNSDNNIDSLPIDILIFNYKAKDYLDDKFVATTNAKVHEPYHLPFNPLSLFGERPLLPVHTANLFKTTLSKAFGLGPVQQSNLNRIIMEAYELKGISKSDRSTWTLPAPTIHDIWEIYSSEEKVTYDSLYAALEKLSSFEIFEPNASNTTSLFDMLDGITVINIAGYDPDIQNLIVAITLDIFYTQMQTKGASKQENGHRQMTKMLLVDEADNFMSQDFESLRKILKEGREFGVGTILSTQQLSHFKTSENDYTEYILSWIIHKVDKIKSQDVNSIFNISSKSEAESLMDQIRQLEEHFSIYVDGKKNMVKMRDLAFWELIAKNMENL
jgi:DNA phosphorothioation-dependent restriction protein DptH